MIVSGLFLRSRVARRVFWALLLAAMLPLALFGALAHHAYQGREQARQQHAGLERLKHIGIRAHDRVVAARAALAAHAAASHEPEAWRSPTLAATGVREMLRRVATVSATQAPIGGDAALARDWAAMAPLPAAAGARVLWWHAAAGAASPMLISWRDDRHGGWWIAEIEPAYLWADFAAEGPAAGLCVTDGQRAPLHCPAGRAPAEAPQWQLFMGGAFGSPDWRLEGDAAVDLAPPSLPLARFALLGGAATMLLIAMLGLVLVRRTMVPLEGLIAGTRALAGGDWSARVKRSSADEFGDLAGSFNQMAGRIGRQIQALEVQAAIDREILGALEIDGVMQRVVQRLLALAPRVPVSVWALAADGVQWQLHRPGQQVAEAPPPGAQAEAPPEDGLALRLTDGGAAWVVPARWQGELVALLCFVTPDVLPLDADARRELGELRDRTAVTLASAMRAHRLEQRAVRDSLTGLLNRHGLHDACDALLGTRGAQFALMMVDLDGFKEVNDTLGHPLGDELLRAVADRLRELAPDAAALARPGGDEFVLLLRGSAVQAQALAEQLCRSLAQPFALQQHTLHLGASAGFACSPDDSCERAELLRRADLAMYAAKAGGRNRAQRYTSALDAMASERAWLVRELRGALDNNALQVHYQPRLALPGGAVRSVEALLRWLHPQRGWIAPARFVRVAEDSGLIAPLGRFVLDAALRQRKAWLDAGLAVGRVAINVSAGQLRDEHFADEVLDLLAQHGLQAQHLELELTESLFAGDPDAVCRCLEPLRQRGVTVALDDFGTGYSSLSALQRLPVDVLKIDRSFVIELGQRESAEAVARSIIALARALSKRVVAEGVETELQEQRLLALGCDEFQGYRYARPMPGGEVAALFDQPLGDQRRLEQQLVPGRRAGEALHERIDEEFELQ